MLPGFSGHLVSEAFLETQLRGIDAPARGQHDLIGWRTRSAAFGPASSPRTLLQSGAGPLLMALGFGSPSQVEAVEPSGTAFAASVRAGSSVVAVLVTPWGERLDSLWRPAVVQAMRRSAGWCLLFNGIHLRIVDATRLYAHRYLEFDLSVALDEARSVAAFCRTFSAEALSANDGSESLRAIIGASDRHAAGVCRSLRDGVLTASADVLGALVARSHPARPPIDDSFEQALTIVYRILFLLFAEARALVPLWHPVYRQSYSIESLRDLAERPQHAPGLWAALRAIARLAHAGCRAGDLRVTPFNGRLFSPARTPLAERRDLDDEAARRAILALSTRVAADRAGRQRIAYRDLGVEQLGAVYETLLDYAPRVERPPAVRGRHVPTIVTLQAGSGVRKATGTFYTPQPIADYLVRRTLGPLVHDASSTRILALRIVDPAMGSGAFLVAACRYLAAAYESALIGEGACHASDVGEAERAAMRRTIAERCLYGVDLNPMAVQLARLSLWLATLAADRPLTFLDHRLQVGDSLLGAWLASLRTAPITRRRSRSSTGSPRSAGTPSELPLFQDDPIREALLAALPVRFSLEATPNDTLDQIRAKERALEAITARHALLSRWKRVANVWCATWFRGALNSDVPAAAFAALSDTILSDQGALPGRTADQYLSAADAVAAARRFFHWELEFPEVFFDSHGARLPHAGFDAVLGNPPWDMIRADAGSPDARSCARDDIAPMLRFTRDAGIYTAQSTGHANRYQLFIERAIHLTRASGRIGLVLPSGLATDHGSAALRQRLLTRCAVDAIVGIDNHRGVFPIHRSVRFLLVTASVGAPTTRIACRLGLDDAAQLESAGDQPADAADWFPVKLSPAVLERISGPALTIPSLRSTVDLAISERAAALFPPLGSRDGWSAAFGRELNATDDRGVFQPVHLRRSGLPVVEGKHLEPFRVAVESVRHTVSAADARRLLRSHRHEQPRLAYRDVASATNRLTLIAALLPGGCVSTHTVFCLRTPLPLSAQYFLCGVFNSFVVNYQVRLRVTTHVTTAMVERLPIPTREIVPSAFREIAALARLLSRRNDPAAFARLNARIAVLYQLSESEFQHVLGTFPLIPVADREQALNMFRQISR